MEKKGGGLQFHLIILLSLPEVNSKQYHVADMTASDDADSENSLTT